MKIYIIYSFKLPCPDTESCPVYCEDCEHPRYPICNSLSTLGIGAAQFRSVTEIAPKRNHCSHVWTEALSSMVSVPAQKLSGINSHVDIKSKLTPSAEQVESDALTVLRANASDFMSFGHSIRHFRDCSMLMRMLTMWSCFLPHLAGWLLVWLRLDVSMTCWS